MYSFKQQILSMVMENYKVTEKCMKLPVILLVKAKPGYEPAVLRQLPRLLLRTLVDLSRIRLIFYCKGAKLRWYIYLLLFLVILCGHEHFHESPQECMRPLSHYAVPSMIVASLHHCHIITAHVVTSHKTTI